MSTAPTPEVWWENREELHFLAEWMVDNDTWMYASRLVDVLEKPWNYEAEYKLAKAVRGHEHETQHDIQPTGDEVEVDGVRQPVWRCGGPGDGVTTCDWQHPPLTVEDRVADLADILKGLE